MNEAGVVSDVTTHAYLVGTFEKLKKLDVVSELLKEMELEGDVLYITSYTVLLEAYARPGAMKKATCVHPNGGVYAK
ncbi:hypothetical protein GIB67_012799 [Kingdonia uniflora]|uniref:Pentatricopeptide repeat-containing protein n=1 Tax=Kingdonia uniflora TaxID=39325 RepID=A0A7J7NFY8_9MAGN|nr:hypothetical protein GIB67_012799 [Kingdonia uniflora]